MLSEILWYCLSFIHFYVVILKMWCVCGDCDWGVLVFLVQISINRKVSVFRGESIINLVMFKISMIS